MDEQKQSFRDADVTYQEEIQQYSFDELLDISHHIDREQFPGRFRLVLQEMEKRKESQGGRKKLLSRSTFYSKRVFPTGLDFSPFLRSSS
jgi:hypothetical protein